MGLLLYHLGYQTEHIPTGFVSVAISGGFGENLANLTGLYVYYIYHTHNKIIQSWKIILTGWLSPALNHDIVWPFACQTSVSNYLN